MSQLSSNFISSAMHAEVKVFSTKLFSDETKKDAAEDLLKELKIDYQETSSRPKRKKVIDKILKVLKVIGITVGALALKVLYANLDNTGALDSLFAEYDKLCGDNIGFFKHTAISQAKSTINRLPYEHNVEIGPISLN